MQTFEPGDRVVYHYDLCRFGHRYSARRVGLFVRYVSHSVKWSTDFCKPLLAVVHFVGNARVSRVRLSRLHKP